MYMNTLTAFRALALLANAGVPMIFVTMPAMVIALAPIIAVEALLIRKRMTIETWPIVRATAAANVASTIVGIPLTWGILFLCQMGLGLATSRIARLENSNVDSPLAQVIVTVLAPAWIAPTDEAGSWAVPLAALVLLVPFFLVSVWLETLVMERMLPVTAGEILQEGQVSKLSLRRAVRDANLLTYAALFTIACVWLVWGVFHPLQ
jgi:hypothetical protein